MANGHIKKIGFKQWLYQYGYIIYLFLLSLFISLQASQNYFELSYPGGDSSVFLTIAKGMTLGKVPYRDFFDHKGPLLYVLNYIGYIIDGVHGVWLVEIVSLSIAIFFTFATIKKFYGRIVSLCATTIGYMALELCLGGGNLTEEYVLPLISIAIYMATSMILSENFSRWKTAILGLTFGLSLMLRPNMFAVWFIFSAYWVIVKLTKKEIKNSIEYIVFFFVGTFIGLLPFMVYLFVSRAFDDYLFQNFIFNFKYASNGGLVTIVKNLFEVPFALASLVIITLVGCVAGFFLKKKKNEQIMFVLLFLSPLLSMLFVSTSQYLFNHYYIVFVPIVAIGIGVWLELFNKVLKDYGIKGKSIAIIFIVMTIFVTSISACKIGIHIFRKIPYKEYSNLADKIDGLADKNDSLQVVSDLCSIYLYTDIRPASKFIYDNPICETSSDVHNQFVEEWTKNNPTFVLAPQNYTDGESEHVKWVANELKEHYTIVFETEQHVLYQYGGL